MIVLVTGGIELLASALDLIERMCALESPKHTQEAA